MNKRSLSLLIILLGLSLSAPMIQAGVDVTSYAVSNNALEDLLKDAKSLLLESPCPNGQEEAAQVLPATFEVLEEQVKDVYEEIYDTKVLMNADITYSFAKAQVADAEIRLTTLNGSVEYIEMEGFYNILGMSGNVNYGFSIDQIMKGQTLGFYTDYDSSPILKITPAPYFSADKGGKIFFEFWDGKKYESLEGHLAKDVNDEFHLYINKVAPENYVNYLKVNVRGITPAGMRIKNYKVAAQ